MILRHSHPWLRNRSVSWLAVTGFIRLMLPGHVGSCNSGLRVGRVLIGLVALIGTLSGQTNSLGGNPQTEVEQQTLVFPPYQAAVAGTALEHAIVPEEYIIGPGDQFIVTIMSVEPYMELVTVSPTQTIVLPNIGALSVAGLSAEAVSESVLSFIKGHFPNYEAVCELYGIREVRVSVSGAVEHPGLVEVTPVSRVTDLLKAAGGVQPEALIHQIQLIRDTGENQLLDLTEYYDEGDLSQNPYLRGGDRVIVPFGEIAEDLVLVRGLGISTGYYVISSGETVASMIRRLALGGNADRGSITIQRQVSGTQHELLLVTADQFSTTALQPGDVLYFGIINEIAIVGEVRSPGRRAYQPGLTVEDYIILAGGTTSNGSTHRVEVTRKNGQTLRSRNAQVQAGDTIYVPRSINSIFLGQVGMIQVALTFLNIYLAYLAARA